MFLFHKAKALYNNKEKNVCNIPIYHSSQINMKTPALEKRLFLVTSDKDSTGQFIPLHILCLNPLDEVCINLG